MEGIKEVDSIIQRQLDTLNQDIINELEEISLHDLLSHSACCIEVLSMLRNVASMNYLFPDREDDKDVEAVLGTLDNIIPNYIIQQAFMIRGELHKARKNNGLPNRNSKYFHPTSHRVTRTAPSRLPEPVARPKYVVLPTISQNAVNAFATRFITSLQKAGKTTFTAEHFCAFVETNYVRNENRTPNSQIQKWSEDDAKVMSSNRPNWKVKCSTALQGAQLAELIKYRKQKDHWYIFTD